MHNKKDILIKENSLEPRGYIIGAKNNNCILNVNIPSTKINIGTSGKGHKFIVDK